MLERLQCCRETQVRSSFACRQWRIADCGPTLTCHFFLYHFLKYFVSPFVCQSIFCFFFPFAHHTIGTFHLGHSTVLRYTENSATASKDEAHTRREDLGNIFILETSIFNQPSWSRRRSIRAFPPSSRTTHKKRSAAFSSSSVTVRKMSSSISTTSSSMSTSS